MELTSEFFKYKNIEEYSKRNHIFLVRKKFHATGLKIKNEVAAEYGSHISKDRILLFQLLAAPLRCLRCVPHKNLTTVEE